MRLLLDTHTLLWWAVGDAKLPRKARSAIGRKENTVLVSAASAWEISTKYRLGRLAIPGPLLDGFLDYLADQNSTALAITVRHAQRAGLLPGCAPRSLRSHVGGTSAA